MGMSAGGSGGGVSSDINVTPMIDILLVLLIIFMVIQPTAVHGLDTLVPQPPKDKNQQENPNDRTIVVQVLSNNGRPAYKINDTDFAKDGLTPKLQEIYATRAEKVMFVKGDKDLDFQYVAEVIDFGHAAGVDNIGLITPRVEAGQ